MISCVCVMLNDTNVIIPNSVLQTHVSVFNFFSVAYPKNFEKKVWWTGLGRQRAALSGLHLQTYSARHNSCTHQVEEAYVFKSAIACALYWANSTPVIGVGRFRILEGPRFRILGGGGQGGGANSKQAHDVVMTSMRRHFDVMCPLDF